jgi:hypothetical protein
MYGMFFPVNGPNWSAKKFEWVNKWVESMLSMLQKSEKKHFV